MARLGRLEQAATTFRNGLDQLLSLGSKDAEVVLGVNLNTHGELEVLISSMNGRELFDSIPVQETARPFHDDVIIQKIAYGIKFQMFDRDD